MLAHNYYYMLILGYGNYQNSYEDNQSQANATLTLIPSAYII